MPPRDRSGQRAFPALLTYPEVVEIKEQIARLDSKFDAVIALRSSVEDLSGRVGALENDRASASGRTAVWDRVTDALWQVLLAIIAAGVWFN